MPRDDSPDRKESRHHSDSAKSHRGERARDHGEHDAGGSRRRSRSPADRHRRRHHELEGDGLNSDHHRSSGTKDGAAGREKDGKRRERDDRGRDRESRDTRRSRSRSRSRNRSDKKHRHRRSRSRSSSHSEGSSSSSEDSRERRHRKKKHRSSRDNDGKDSNGRNKEERRRRREEKKEKRDRKSKKKAGVAVVEWGKHGIISETDIYTKDQEFRAWLVGERMINPETLSKVKEKDIFRIFMEEFNTGTLPHDKYYDLTKYEAKMNAVRMGETVQSEDRYDPNKDLDALRNAHKRAPVETESFLDKSKLEALRNLQRERVEMDKMKRLGLKPRESMGVRMETAEEAKMKM